MDRHATTSAIAAPRPQHPRLLAWSWLPLALLVAWFAATTMGLGPSAAVAATTTVQGTVDKAVTLDTSGCAGAPTLAFAGGLVPDDTWVWTTQDCVVSFSSSNSSAGASLQVGEAGALAGPALKCVSPSCTGDSIGDVAPNTAPPAANSNFGAILWGTSGAAAPVWNVGTPGSPVGYPVADVPDTACQTSSIALGQCQFRFGAQAKIGADQPGSYQAQVEFTSMAN